MTWRLWFAGASIYVLVSTMGDGLHLETFSDWADASLRACAAMYLAQWVAYIIGKAGQE